MLRQKQTSFVLNTHDQRIIRAAVKKGDAVSCKTEDRIMHIDRITRHTQIFYVHIDSAFFTSAFTVQSAWCGSSRRGRNE